MEQLEALLDKATEGLRGDVELFLSRIPPTVRSVKMRDLREKYGGDLTACMEAQAVGNCKSKYTALFILPTITPQRTRTPL